MLETRTIREKRPFSRRCGWCCVTLRAWQLNLCRTCKRDVFLNAASPHRSSRSYHDEEPDRFPVQFL